MSIGEESRVAQSYVCGAAKEKQIYDTRQKKAEPKPFHIGNSVCLLENSFALRNLNLPKALFESSHARTHI